MNRVLAAACAAIALGCALAIEHFLLAAPPAMLISGLADFRPAWNHGVSFSLLWQSGNAGRYALTAFLVALVLVVAAMAWRARSGWTAAGFGLVLGGALANLFDRIHYGAVFDYLFLHLGTRPLFVCNAADIAISAGVMLLAVESVVAGSRA